MLGLGGLSANNAEAQTTRRGAVPKNIIFCVADGQAIASITMADQYQRYLMGKGSYLCTLLDDPHCHNRLATHLVTLLNRHGQRGGQQCVGQRSSYLERPD